MDWFKVESNIATNPKIDALSDGAYRALTYLWGHAMIHETGGAIPRTATKLIPKVTSKRMQELVSLGFLHTNGVGWMLHDWDEHQEEALRVQEKKVVDRNRKREERAAKRELH